MESKKIKSLRFQIKSLEDQVGKDLDRLHNLRNKLNKYLIEDKKEK